MSERALKRLATYICLMLCVIVLGNVTVFADEVKPAWTTLAPMSTYHCIPMSNFQTEVIDGKLYAIGGKDDRLEMYNPAANTWTILAYMSTPRTNFQTEVINGKIYAIGGMKVWNQNDDQLLSSAEVYDPATNTWTAIASMSTPRYWFQTEVIDGKIYAIGGGGSSGTLSSAEVYDPAADTWTSIASMSTPSKRLKTEVVNGKIYAIGGQDSSTLSSVEMYDPTTNTWTTLASMSTPRTTFETEVVNGKIYAIGGSSGSINLKTAEVYDPTTDAWTKLPFMSTSRVYFRTDVVEGKIYAIGGYASGSTLSSVEMYDPTTNTWTPIGAMSTPRSNLETEVIDGKIYAIGGINMSSMEVYTATANSENKLKATAGNSKVDLTWDAVDKATGYTVKRATTAGGPYTTIATDLTDTSYTDSDVKNGTTYYYIVSAINAGTEIGDSNEAAAQPTESQTPPVTDSKLKVVMEISESLRLSVDNDLNVNTQMAWSSSEPTVATVNEKGIVTALAPGNTVITVKSADGSYTDYINVLVVENADDYRLAIDLRVGETARLTADDFTNTENITWAPMDSAIANVTTKGKVTALSKGLVLISAKDAEGNIIGHVYVRVRE